MQNNNFTQPLALNNIDQGSDLKDENNQDGEETFKLTR